MDAFFIAGILATVVGVIVFVREIRLLNRYRRSTTADQRRVDPDATGEWKIRVS